MAKIFTGKHMALTMVGFFGVVIAVNVTMASYATSTFGGVVVENSYVASQEFNALLERKRQQDALGWTVEPSFTPDGRVTLTLGGVPQGTAITATARHPLGRAPDVPLSFVAAPDGLTATSDRSLPEGRWLVRLDLRDGADRFRLEQEMRR